VRADLRRLGKSFLDKYGWRPDDHEKAAETVLERAGVLGAQWTAVGKGVQQPVAAGGLLCCLPLDPSVSAS